VSNPGLMPMQYPCRGGSPHSRCCGLSRRGVDLPRRLDHATWQTRRLCALGLAGIGCAAFTQSSVFSATVCGMIRCYDLPAHEVTLTSGLIPRLGRSLGGPACAPFATGPANQRSVDCARASASRGIATASKGGSGVLPMSVSYARLVGLWPILLGAIVVGSLISWLGLI
jgi:hypothetical protein